MKNVKKSFRKTELSLFVVGLLIGLMIWIFPQESGGSGSQRLIIGVFSKTAIIDCVAFGKHLKCGLIGYFICFIIFTLSYELFFLFETNSKSRKWPYLLLTNFKLVIIGSLFYTVRLTGIPLINLVIGFIACQTLAVFFLLINASRSNNLLIARNTETDSKD